MNRKINILILTTLVIFLVSETIERYTTKYKVGKIYYGTVITNNEVLVSPKIQQLPATLTGKVAVVRTYWSLTLYILTLLKIGEKVELLQILSTQEQTFLCDENSNDGKMEFTRR